MKGDIKLPHCYASDPNRKPQLSLCVILSEYIHNMSSEPVLPTPQVAPGPAPADDAIKLRLSTLAHQQELWLAALNAVGDSIISIVIASANDPASVTTCMSKAIGQAFDTWAGLVQGHDSQLSILLPKSLYDAHTNLREARTHIGELKVKLGTTLSMMESIKLANDSLLLEQLGGISIKLSSLLNWCTKALELTAVPPTKPMGSISAKTPQPPHALRSKHAATTGPAPKGKKWPAIFTLVNSASQDEPPAKRPASATKAQRVQEAFTIPRN